MFLCKHCAGLITTLFFSKLYLHLYVISLVVSLLLLKILCYECRHTYGQKGLLVKHEPLTVNSILIVVNDSNQFLKHSHIAFIPFLPFKTL